MKSVRAGKYRQRVTFQRAAGSLDSYRQYSDNFLFVASFPAEVVAQGGLETVAGTSQVVATATYIVKFRWMGTAVVPQANDRIVLADGTNLNVINANNAENRNVEWIVTCGQVAQPPGI